MSASGTIEDTLLGWHIVFYVWLKQFVLWVNGIRLVLTSGMALGNSGSQFSALIASDAARSPESTAPSIAPLNAVEVSVPAQ
jgi:hypothetical protein